MYGIGGERNLAETTLRHLKGYEGSRPGAQGQRRLHASARTTSTAPCSTRSTCTPSATTTSTTACGRCCATRSTGAWRVWRKPDQGIWEARGEPRHYVSSKLMCWVALDRGARLAELRGEPELAERWQDGADEIRADILERGVDERGVFVQHYDTTALDASNLLIPIVRFLPADDERVRATVLAIADELNDHGLILRYRVEETDDGLSGEEGTFLICSFWMVSALSEIGERERARALCERLLSLASPLALYAEELDARSGRHLGNFPQAFTHLALINAVAHVIADGDSSDRRLRDERPCPTSRTSRRSMSTSARCSPVSTRTRSSRPQFRKADTIVQYVYRKPDALITIKMLEGQEGQVDLGPTDLEPEVVMTMDADVAHRFWLGKVNVTIAIARGQIKTRGRSPRC